jgi:16S rRNA (uracil1498-N3)-methyltransferase
MDWIMQKAVELGVARIAPVACRRSVIRLSGERMERRVAHWQAVAVAACEQCRRNRVPEVVPLVDLPQFLGGSAGDNGLRLILAPDAGTRLAALPKPTGLVTLLVGPEGGFDEGELAAAASAGFQAVSLGPRVLRTETAGLAALAAMMALWGDF